MRRREITLCGLRKYLQSITFTSKEDNIQIFQDTEGIH